MSSPAAGRRAPSTGRGPAHGGPSQGTGHASDPEPGALTLITGGEAFLMARAAARVVRQLEAAHPGCTATRVDASDPGALSALPEALSPSLFSPVALAVVTAVEAASEAVTNLLLALLGDLGDTRVVVLHSGLRSRASLDRLRDLPVPGGVAVIDCPPVKRGRATREFLQAEAARAGRRLAGEPAEALSMAVGTDIALLVGSLEQLLADVPEDPIRVADVATMVSGVAEVTGFGFSDALWERDPHAALTQLRWGEVTNSLSAPGATGSAAAGLRAMVRAGDAPRGMSEAEVARVAGVPPFKVRALQAQRRRWTDAEIAEIVVALARADVAVKGGLLPGDTLDPGQKSHALERWVRMSTQVDGPD